MLKEKGIWLAIWAGMYLLCAVLGFLPPQEGGNRVLLVILALLFFAPPGWVLWLSLHSDDLQTIKRLLLLSAVSLGSTMVLIVLNFLSVLGPDWLGDFLYFLLIALSAPMLCGQYWVLSLTLWAILLWSSLLAWRHLQKK